MAGDEQQLDRGEQLVLRQPPAVLLVQLEQVGDEVLAGRAAALLDDPVEQLAQLPAQGGRVLQAADLGDGVAEPVQIVLVGGRDADQLGDDLARQRIGELQPQVHRRVRGQARQPVDQPGGELLDARAQPVQPALREGGGQRHAQPAVTFAFGVEHGRVGDDAVDGRARRQRVPVRPVVQLPGHVRMGQHGHQRGVVGGGPGPHALRGHGHERACLTQPLVVSVQVGGGRVEDEAAVIGHLSLIPSFSR